MIPKGAREYTVKEIAGRFDVSPDTVSGWCSLPGFPQWAGTPRRRRFPADQVDAWVEKNRPALWAAMLERESDEPKEPAGDPEDLLDADDFARARAERLHQRPVPADTISSYVTRKILPKPDRTPDDGLIPEVSRNSWYRRTVEASIADLRGPGRHAGSRKS